MENKLVPQHIKNNKKKIKLKYKDIPSSLDVFLDKRINYYIFEINISSYSSYNFNNKIVYSNCINRLY